MSPSELGHMLNFALRDRESAISLTLTTVSKEVSALEELLNTALVACRRHGAQLTEIRLAIADYPNLGMHFHDVPIADSGNSGVLRLMFEPPMRYDSRVAA